MFLLGVPGQSPRTPDRTNKLPRSGAVCARGMEAAWPRLAIPLAGSKGARFTTARSFHGKDAHTSILGKFANDLGASGS